MMIRNSIFSQRKTFMAFMAAAAFYAGQPALAQSDASSSPSQSLSAQQALAMRQDMEKALHYKLSADVLPRLTHTLQAIHAAGIQPPGRIGMSLDQQIEMVSKTAKLDPVLKANGFTARDFVMSLTCVGLTGSLMNAQGAGGALPQPDPQNIALLKAHPDQLQALISVLRAEGVK